MQITLGQQYNVGEKSTVILYIYINMVVVVLLQQQLVTPYLLVLWLIMHILRAYYSEKKI